MADDTRKQTGARSRSATGRTSNSRRGATAKRAASGEQAGETVSKGVADPARRAGEALKESGQKLAQGGSEIGARIIEQAEQNAREAFAAMRAAASAGDLAEVMKIQGDYLREQSKRSMDQARELGEMMMQVGQRAAAPLKPGGPGKS
jgi:hypothetical protein